MSIIAAFEMKENGNTDLNNNVHKYVQKCRNVTEQSKSVGMNHNKVITEMMQEQKGS